jgi:acetylornithine deacetylase/succinyl-diaminopimelate desuccinylase-like protein
MDSINQYLEDNLETSIAELSRYCAQPSIAATGRGITECADLTAELLRARGFTVELIPTADGAPPVVFAERKGRSDKTLIFYNHYDVQPEDPVELWDSPPFEPQLRDGKLYARGVGDDKGHTASRLFAIDAILAAHGELPCNVKFLIEGEEEIGSPHLEPVIAANRRKFAADACVWEFGGVNHEETPEMVVGMRGICYVELSIETASQDSHSGLSGSIFHNAAWRLVWALRTIKGSDERIRIPGFYDNIVPPAARDRELLAKLPPMMDELRARYGLQEFLRGTDDELELALQASFEPTATICGLTSGYQGKGSKTVLPAKAAAKVDFRLVPEQEPQDILRKLRAHLDAEGFPDVHIQYNGGVKPGRTDPDHPFIRQVMDAALPIYGKPMLIYPLIGGSGPNRMFLDYLGAPIATSGCGYPGTNAHAPNENIRLDLYLKGAKHAAALLQAFAAGS